MKVGDKIELYINDALRSGTVVYVDNKPVLVAPHRAAQIREAIRAKIGQLEEMVK